LPADSSVGFRLGISVCEDAEIVDLSAPYGVLLVACRWDPSLDVFTLAESTGLIGA